MTAQILELASERAVDEAWDALQKHRAPLIGNSRLLLDREWVEQEARLHARFVKLFQMQEAAG